MGQAAEREGQISRKVTQTIVSYTGSCNNLILNIVTSRCLHLALWLLTLFVRLRAVPIFHSANIERLALSINFDIQALKLAFAAQTGEYL